MELNKLKVKHNKDSIVFIVDGDVLATVNRSALEKLITAPKITKPKTSSENKVNILIKEYKKAWGVFYKTAPRADYKKGTKDYSNFVKAAAICIQHDAKAKTFIEAQVEGLKFVGGTGIFPKPNQLATPNAETRLLDYIKDNSIDSKPVLSWELDTPLEKNAKYQQIKSKIKDNTASLKEARYAMECEMSRTGRVSIGTRAYVAVMEENAK